MMKFKDYEPLDMQMFQSEVEELLSSLPDGCPAKYKLQCKVDYHILHGNWK